jgi:hypothetical protein
LETTQKKNCNNLYKELLIKERIKYAKEGLPEKKSKFLALISSKLKKTVQQEAVTPPKAEKVNRISMSPDRDRKKIRDSKKRKISMLLHGEEQINKLAKEVHHAHDIILSPFKYKHQGGPPSPRPEPRYIH